MELLNKPLNFPFPFWARLSERLRHIATCLLSSAGDIQHPAGSAAHIYISHAWRAGRFSADVGICAYCSCVKQEGKKKKKTSIHIYHQWDATKNIGLMRHFIAKYSQDFCCSQISLHFNIPCGLYMLVIMWVWVRSLSPNTAIHLNTPTWRHSDTNPGSAENMQCEFSNFSHANAGKWKAFKPTRVCLHKPFMAHTESLQLRTWRKNRLTLWYNSDVVL